MNIKRLLLSAIAAGALAAGTAHADVIFTAGNHPQANEANILFETSEIGVTLDNGEVDHTGTGVTFKSLTQQLITQQAQGQADIFCAFNCVNNGGNMSSQLSSIEMIAGLDANGKPTAWTDAILNLDFGTGTALVTALDNFSHSFSFLLGNGQNFLTLTTANNEFITDIKVVQDPNSTGAFGFNSFKQPRVSGLCELASETSCIPIPEPWSLTLLGGSLVSLGGFLWWRRRRDDRHDCNTLAA